MAPGQEALGNEVLHATVAQLQPGREAPDDIALMSRALDRVPLQGGRGAKPRMTSGMATQVVAGAPLQ